MRSYRPKKELHFDSEEEERAAAVKKVMDLLLYRDRSEAELRGRLSDRGFSAPAVDAAIAYVVSYGYLNDQHFAETYAAARAGQKSRTAIARELREKGVADSVIQNVIEELPADESVLALELIRKKQGIRTELEEKDVRRLFGFLARKGFSSSDIWKAIRSFREERS